MFTSSNRRPYKAVGINIYGGGFTVGVLRHFNVVGQWEEINLGKRTFDMNFSGIPRPLRLEDWPVAEWKDKVDFVYANPPCAPWSPANNHAGKTKDSRFYDKRLSLTEHTYKAAIELNPKVFVSESVEAAYDVGSPYYQNFARLWTDAGYHVTWFLTDALLHGAPCRRRRFHFFASRYRLRLGKPPSPTNVATVRQAIWDLASPKTFGTLARHEFSQTGPASLDHLLPRVPPGGKLQELINRIPGYQGVRVGFLIRRLCWDTVAPTIVGFSFIHPDGERWITFREALRLRTYPDTFNAATAVEAVDAVLPTVAEFLAVVAKNTIKAAEPASPGFSLVDWRPLGRKFHADKVNGHVVYDLPKQRTLTCKT